ncbi:MAG: sulfatase [Gemmatimonadaceae bacterium]
MIERPPTQPRSRAELLPAEIALIAAWIALLTSLVELAAPALKEFVLHRGYILRPQVVWFTLLAQMLVFAVPYVILALLGRRWQTLRTRGLVTTVFATLGFLVLLLHEREKLHPLALIALSVGLGVQAGRMIVAHPQGFERLTRLTTPAFAVIALIAGTALGIRPLIIERRAVSGIPAARDRAPNILLLILDTVRAESLSLYGYARSTTPNLERLASRGVRFTRAFAPAPWTLPSHASLFTGRYPHEMPWLFARKPLDGTYPTIAEILRDNGYATAAFTANWAYVTHEHGLSRGFAHFDDHFEYSSFGMELLRSSPLLEAIAANRRVRLAINWRDIIARKRAATVNTEFLDWLSSRPPRPFFAFLNYMDAHMPYMPPKPFDRQFAEPGEVEPDWEDILPKGDKPGQLTAMRNRYDGSIAYVDQQIGLLLNELEERGLLENTIIVVSSDHGETLGEHGRALLHATSLYATELHVPLVMTFSAQVPANTVVGVPVTLRDVPATILALAGFGGMQKLPGRSLAGFWRGEVGGDGESGPVLSEAQPLPGFTKPYHPVAKGNMRSLVSGWLHYIRNGDGREELYDLESDPREQRDLANTPEKGQHLRALSTSMDVSRGNRHIAR